MDVLFRRPMDIPISFSGTFAELRDNHFHSGIDYRTQSVVGHKIYACEEGYVSRISVSPVGFGKALYITHPNGYTTVYAHLDNFGSKIADYVKQGQYDQERFVVNLHPDSALLPVKRGEVIALSGNTGSSSGPHLHFEIRDTKTGEPLNPFMFGLGIRDNAAPVMRQLAVYPIGNESTVNGSNERLILNLEKVGNTYRIAAGDRLSVAGSVAFGIDTHDLVSGSNFRCGPYRIRLWIDSAMMFSQTMDRFSFNDKRYINSLIDYEYYVNNRVRFNRMYIEPNNLLKVYDRHINRGIISFPHSGNHKAMVVVSDFHDNKAQLDFSFDYIPSSYNSMMDMFNDGILESWNHEIARHSYKKEFVHAQPGIRVVIPADALYDEIDFSCAVSSARNGLYSATYSVHNRNTPLHKAMTIDIAADNLPERLRDKALIVQIGANGRLSNAGGAYKDGVVSVASRTFGDFAIGVDTVPPRITPVNIRNGANMREAKNIRFTITDDFSGIGSYNGWINGEWALFEYDAKNNLLYYDFDATRLTKNSQHTLELKAADSKGNMAEYKATFTW